jgi:hypothetical protein
MVQQQGGDPRVVDDYGRLPSAPGRAVFAAERAGYVTELDAELVGRAAMVLGAGRDRVDDVVDPGVGVILKASDQLKALARARGTYYRGTLSFASIPNGLIFVDTVSGNNPTRSTAPSDLASVTVGPGAFTDTTGFHGWIVVNGNIDFSGNFSGITGMVYAVGDVTMTGMGPAGVTGFMVVQRILDTESRSAGNANVAYSCAAARGDGQIPTGWYVKGGTYRELSD